MTGILRPALLLLSIALAVGCDRSGPPPSTGSAPRGIILIVVDTLRADRLSSYGYAGHTTPHIDALAETGVRFARARAVASWTVPSMGALLTSRLAAELDLVEREDGKWRTRKQQRRKQRSLALPEDTETVATALTRAGFRTAAFVDQPLMSPRRGFHRGFDDWFQPDAEGAVRRHGDTASSGRQTWSSAAIAYESDRALVERFEAWLASHADAPHLFALLHFLTPHLPYAPPTPYAEGLGPESGESERYHAEVRAADAIVGRALAAVETHVGWSDALVVLTSDHGEAFGEHGHFEHGNTLHWEVQDVPLLLSAPGRLPEGVTIDALVRTIDVAPTLIALAGDSAPGGMVGQSLLPLLEAPRTSRPVYAEGVLYGATERSYTEGGWKLLLDEEGSRTALFEIDRDPWEQIDLSRREPQRVVDLRARMEAIRRGLTPGRPASQAGESAETLEALRALGYLESDPATGRPHP